MAFPPLPAHAQTNLVYEVQRYVIDGWRIEYQSHNMAVLTRGGSAGPRTNPLFGTLLNVLLTVFTCGLWAPIWLIIVIAAPKATPPMRVVLTVDHWGIVHRS